MLLLQALSTVQVLGLSLAFLKGKKSFLHPTPCQRDGRTSLLHLKRAEQSQLLLDPDYISNKHIFPEVSIQSRSLLYTNRVLFSFSKHWDPKSFAPFHLKQPVRHSGKRRIKETGLIMHNLCYLWVTRITTIEIITVSKRGLWIVTHRSKRSIFRGLEL